MGEVAAEVEQADGTEPLRRRLRVLGGLGVDRDGLVRGEDERGLGGERGARERDVERAVDVAGDEVPRSAHVEHRAAVGRVDRPERLLRADERPAVELDDVVHVGRARRRRVGALQDELVLVDVERVVEAALEPDRGRGLRAHARAAERAGHVPGVELDAVWELEQLLQAAVEAGRALGRLAGQVRPGRVSDQQRVAGDHEPGLLAARAVDHREATVLRPVPGRMNDADLHLAERDLLPVLERLVRVLGLGGRVDVDGRAVLEREASVTGDVVGVRVRLEDARDAHVALLGLREVGLDRVRGIDDHGLTRGLVADQVGRAAEIVVDELPKLHEERS